MAEHTRLLATLIEAFGQPPASALRFDACLASDGDGPQPDFAEASPQVSGAALSPWRMTHYFDLDEHALARRREVFDKFSGCAEALDLAIPQPLARLLAKPTPDPALRQLCLGIDARPSLDATRLKLYAIFQGDAAAYTRALCTALEVEPPDAANLELTHIVGIDLDARGLHDVKLYFALPPSKVTRTLRRPKRAINLLRGCRRVVYQRSLIVAGKQSYHFHASAPELLRAELERLREHAPATIELERRLAQQALAPWILAHPFTAGELERSKYSLYLHLV